MAFKASAALSNGKPRGASSSRGARATAVQLFVHRQDLLVALASRLLL